MRYEVSLACECGFLGTPLSPHRRGRCPKNIFFLHYSSLESDKYLTELDTYVRTVNIRNPDHTVLSDSILVRIPNGPILEWF